MIKNYKTLLIFFCCITCWSSKIYAQQNLKITPATTESRYKFDFEIKDVKHPDKVLLSKIKIEQFDYLRQPHDRVQAKDGVNQLILILYSEDEVVKNKASLGKKSTMKTVTDVKFVSTPKIAQ